MQTITIQMNDSIAEHVLFFLKQLPKKELTIIKSELEYKLAHKVSKSLQEVQSKKTRPLDALINEL